MEVIIRGLVREDSFHELHFKVTITKPSILLRDAPVLLLSFSLPAVESYITTNYIVIRLPTYMKHNMYEQLEMSRPYRMDASQYRC